MSHSPLAIGALALAVIIVSAPSRAADASSHDTGPTFGAPYAFTEQGGETIYRSVCAGCHMPNGHGAAGAGAYPSLADNARLAARGYPISIVLHGQRAMPPFAHSLSNEQIAAVVTFIRSHFGNDYPDAVTSSEVSTVR